jgi:hypothetical protein
VGREVWVASRVTDAAMLGQRRHLSIEPEKEVAISLLEALSRVHNEQNTQRGAAPREEAAREREREREVEGESKRERVPMPPTVRGLGLKRARVHLRLPSLNLLLLCKRKPVPWQVDQLSSEPIGVKV